MCASPSGGFCHDQVHLIKSPNIHNFQLDVCRLEKTFSLKKRTLGLYERMANIGLILFVVCVVINSMYNAERTDKGRLNSKVKKLNIKTDSLQKEVNAIWKEVDDIWAEVSEPGTVAPNYINRTITDSLGNASSQNFKTNRYETVNTVQDLKTEVKHLMSTSRNGLRNEKQWQRETVRNLTEMYEDFQTNLNTTLDDLRANQHKLETENQALKQTILECKRSLPK